MLLTAPAVAQAQVRFERTGYRLTSIGERVAVAGRVLDARRRPVPTGRIRWRVADPTIATVSPQGVVVSRRAGNTRLWAVAGNDSASALIVVDQWAAKFEFAPAILRLDAVGAKAPVRISVRDAQGTPIADQSRKAGACRSLNERVATFNDLGEVTAHANGVTYVRCTDRGVSDSVRVEVRQRPASVRIADAATLRSTTKYVGELWTLRLTAADRSGDEIRDPQASWASLNPTIISIDPLSGATRAVGAGTARIVAQVGDVSDTVSIPVSPSLGQPVPPNADTATAVDVITVRVPTLNIEPFNAIEGEQSVVRFSAKDATGAEVKNAEVLLRSSDPSVLEILPGLKVHSKKSGAAWIIGRFGNAFDSVNVVVRSLATRLAAETNESARTAAFVRPTINTDSLLATHRVYRARVDSALRDSRIVRISSGRFISLEGTGGQMSYSFRDSTGLEKRTGVTFGGSAEMAPFKWMRLTFDYRTGTLKPDQTGGNDVLVTQMGGDVTFVPAPYLGVRLGYFIRALREGDQSAIVALQQYTVPRAGIVSRFNFIGGRITSIAGLSVLAGSDYSGSTERPEPFSYSGEAGLEFNSGWFTTNLLYSVEHFGFPKVGTQQRIDQFSSLRLKVGLRKD